MIDFIVALLRNTGMLAVVAVGYGFVAPRLKGPASALVLGLLCGLGACATMLDPISIQAGIFVDSRTTMVVLAGFFGGPLAGGIAAALPSVLRIHFGGIGAPAGVLSILISLAIGLAGYYIFYRKSEKIRYRHIIVLASATPLTTLSLLLLPPAVALEVLTHSGWTVNLMRLFGVVFLGAILLHEQQRGRAEARVREMAYIDELSGLANRRAFFAHLTKEWKRWERYDEAFTIVLVDIDRFKLINDTFGHPVGDIVIQRLARIMLEESRTSDVVARTGGEEFGLLLPYTTSASGYLVAERIRARVESEVLVAEGNDIRFTVSLGVSADVESYSTMSRCLSGADRALYEAKHLGRNTVVIDTPTLDEADGPPARLAMVGGPLK
ncbi:diguanylate cyclase [Amorphus orientalis]|uniref:diguanylate cyclase n=1 Tax=Amorphus orientalis TaxID=649198 RepID=A0AAE3VQM9_9HYPH|nr:diguanylate cyclase [Amorphus orientalis]MDQ0315981.1 diguanylate cyclase [Amorphus orientalis]